MACEDQMRLQIHNFHSQHSINDDFSIITTISHNNCYLNIHMPAIRLPGKEQHLTKCSSKH